ncbi:hypothetical protein SAMN05421819_3870 [Bryocella elongata]|uniref:Uncharacterized protein n=1 Tax=Bryocella elongata TaxID=863522 RepID=A0A1H6BN36_9BACT|nr:hypothetical protein [Bryocella elongata]SEG62118.1 hypothetical protein SAMN05421819_3870 [Bryocella elongata]
MIPRVHTEPHERPAAAAASGLSVDVRCFSYEERRTVLPALLDAVSTTGGWILDRQVLPSGRVEFWFEVQLRSIMELYSAVVGAGMEFTRAGHRDLTSLCTLRQNTPVAGCHRLISIRMEVSFLDEDEHSLPMVASRAALA